jgi:hypothetical protein
LFALGVELVVQRGSGTPHVMVARDSSGRHCVTVDRRAAPNAAADDLILVARGVIEPTLTCLRAVADVAGVSLTWNEQTPSLLFSFPEHAKGAHDGRVGA